ncbi:Protein of unknown function [Salegentibacter echinorum]|uniref:DUF262 domain-containing protein n=1 Tax=Salegentibacter echinorum TaxID=1073325 RepID=A0A1M5LTK7_SALEC|nr:DUF262 domain-containing protein [Salegentibacter echinorum]SHG68341.1 Protein of unknown function [Salegentibacter echinorum]
MEKCNPLQFKSEIVCLQDLSTAIFSIPTYQRPYVWKIEQIDKLLKDCANAFSFNKDKGYFIGTILTDKKDNNYELIDGQQRFTTLWLIAFVYYKKGIESKITNFLRDGDNLRLDFEIRKEVSNYFELLLEHPDEALKKFDSEELEEKPYLINIIKAVTIINGILETLINPKTKQLIDFKDFGDYLYTQLKIVNNITPQNEKFDLNKLFATVNNSGIQLEQTDIVKANLLSKIKTDKILFSKIWESCENMSEYFERNVRKVFAATNWKNLKPQDFAVYNKDIFLFKQEEEIDELALGYSIQDIDEGKADEFAINSPLEEKNKQYEINCDSILNFGQLLLHTYRIYLYRNRKPDFNVPFHIDRLISIFKNLQEDTEENIKSFFELLWEVRYAFDSNIVKWITDLDTKEKHLELSVVTKNDQKENYTYFGRNVIEKSEQLMLQSVLYFTGDYLRQYWLTPYLYFLLVNKENDLNQLEKIDNQMSLTKKTDKEASFLLLNPNYNLSRDFILKDYLNGNLGTSFQHYWFLKLEYILWKNWEDQKDPKFQKYRITSKNSVEHIYPQNPEFAKRLEKRHMDNFGNLVLLSVNQNSEYSRKAVNVKREEFRNKTGYDTLKSYHIFNSYTAEWKETTIELHKEEMIDLFIAHYETSSFFNSPFQI